MLKKKWWIIIIILLGYLAFSSLFVVQQYEVVVVTQFGDPIRIVDDAGLKVKLPYPFQRTYTYDRRINTFDPPEAEFLTQDKKNILVDTFICWRVSDPIKFLQTVIDENGAEARLSDIIWADVGATLGNVPLDGILSTNAAAIITSKLEENISRRLNREAMEQFGAEVLTFRIKRLNYPDQNKRSVFDRMVAERERIATQFRSEGEEEAIKIRSQADRERAQFLAEARREAEIIKGRADAEATRIYADAFKRYPGFYRFLRTLEAYRKIINENSIIVIPADSVLLKYLNNPEAE